VYKVVISEKYLKISAFHKHIGKNDILHGGVRGAWEMEL
jgi:hypothetical protein